MRTPFLTSLALTAALALAAPAGAARVEGVPFAPRLEGTGGGALDLCSAGLLRYKVVFRAYVAALYLPDCDGLPRVLDDGAKRLEISYFWAIPAAKFGEAADAILARSLPAEEIDRLRARLDTLHAAYRDVEPGDRYALTYVPGRGTTLSLGDVELATIPGADFARAYFGIWLGDEPGDAGLRRRLLTPIAPERS